MASFAPYPKVADDVEVARRKSVLLPSDDFFDYRRVVGRPLGRFRALFAEVHAALDAEAVLVPRMVVEGMLRRWEAPDETEAHRVYRVGWG